MEKVMVTVYNSEIDECAAAISSMTLAELATLAERLAVENASLADSLADYLIDAVFATKPPLSEMTPQHRRLYAALTESYGAIVPRAKLWPLLKHGGQSKVSLEVAICRLREVLTGETVVAVRNRGYKMERKRNGG